MTSEDKTTLSAEKTTITDGDLISRDYTIQQIQKAKESNYNFNYNTLIDFIKMLPSAEKTAEWIYDGSLGYHGESHYKCSVCGKRAKEKEVNGKLVGGYGPEAIGSEWICDYEPDFTNYCSNCGAKMKKLGECNE